MSRQKCDYLTIEERQTWNRETLMHSDKAERKAFEAVAAEWNLRQPNATGEQTLPAGEKL